MPESIKKYFKGLLEFIGIINRHNIFMFSSSLSYYAALSLAPFLLILLKVGSIIGRDKQEELVLQTQFIFGQDVAKIIDMLFKNINEGINLASFSGIIGVVTILLSVSVIFLQLRYCLDVISGDYDPNLSKSFKAVVLERLFLMVVVVGTALLFFLSIFISNIIKLFAGDIVEQQIIGEAFLYFLNLLVNVLLFLGIYFFVPSKRPKFRHALYMSLFSALCFLVGKILIEQYVKNVAGHSVYGAAGTLLVFLVWAYYSAFTFFLSMEIFLFIEQKKLKPHLVDGASNLL